jgi:glycosyltransferase involved in cell wall biosynthesis
VGVTDTMASSGGRRTVSVVTPCYNEAENVEELVARICAVMESLPYDYEHILIDNASTDGTAAKIKELAAADPHVKLIVNVRNFGHIRSPAHGMLQASGDAVIMLASDLQDPPELIPEFIEPWEKGAKVVFAVKPDSETSALFHWMRGSYYRLLTRISESKPVEHATGAGLYDREVVEQLRALDDPYPYTRGLIAELGYDVARVEFVQPRRKRGVTKNNFGTLFDMAMLGVTNHSKAPLRMLSIGGFSIAILSLLAAILYLIAKLVWWDQFPAGTAPILIAIFFFGAVQLAAIGLLGEYVITIHTRSRHLPLVVEEERVGFDRSTADSGPP